MKERGEGERRKLEFVKGQLELLTRVEMEGSGRKGKGGEGVVG